MEISPTQPSTFFVIDSCVLINVSEKKLQPIINRILIPTMVKFELGTRPGRSHILSFLHSCKDLRQLTMNGRIVPFANSERIVSVTESRKRIESEGNDEAILDACRLCDHDVVLVTDDVNMRLKARSFGVIACS